MTPDQKLVLNLKLLGLGCGESCGCRDRLVETFTPAQREALSNLNINARQAAILERIQDTKKAFAELGIGAEDEMPQDGDLNEELKGVLGVMILSSLLARKPREENPLEELLDRIRRTQFKR